MGSRGSKYPTTTNSFQEYIRCSKSHLSIRCLNNSAACRIFQVCDGNRCVQTNNPKSAKPQVSPAAEMDDLCTVTSLTLTNCAYNAIRRHRIVDATDAITSTWTTEDGGGRPAIFGHMRVDNVQTLSSSTETTSSVSDPEFKRQSIEEFDRLVHECVNREKLVPQKKPLPPLPCSSPKLAPRLSSGDRQQSTGALLTQKYDLIKVLDHFIVDPKPSPRCSPAVAFSKPSNKAPVRWRHSPSWRSRERPTEFRLWVVDNHRKLFTHTDDRRVTSIARYCHCTIHLTGKSKLDRRGRTLHEVSMRAMDPDCLLKSINMMTDRFDWFRSYSLTTTNSA